MTRRALGNTGLAIVPLVLGGNVIGWAIDEKQSFAVLDAFIDHGFNAIDTADVYSSPPGRPETNAVRALPSTLMTGGWLS
jgi:aryl-alcohol dehydrogenase-like predicted oxidoreductase